MYLDHHQIPQQEYDNEKVINAWKYGIDGGTEICAGGMAYLAAMALDDKNSDLSAIAVVSALGIGKTREKENHLLEKILRLPILQKKKGCWKLIWIYYLVGRETRPLPDALAFTSQPFIEGLTWNRDACLSLLNSSGIQLKDGGRWRVPAELNDEEKRIVIETITKFTSGKNATEIMSELIGYTYTFPREDKRKFFA